MEDGGHAADITATMNYDDAVSRTLLEPASLGNPSMPYPHPEDGFGDELDAGGYDDMMGGDSDDLELDEYDDVEYEPDPQYRATTDGVAGTFDTAGAILASGFDTIPGGYPAATTLRQTQDRLRREAVRKHIDECEAAITDLQRQLIATQQCIAEAEEALSEANSRVENADPHPTLLASSIDPNHMRTKVKEWDTHTAKLEKQRARELKRVEGLYTALDSQRDALAQAELNLSRFGSLAGELQQADVMDAKTTSILGYARANHELTVARKEVAAHKAGLKRQMENEARILAQAQELARKNKAARAKAKPLMQASFKKASDRNQQVSEMMRKEDERRINSVLTLKENRDTALAKDRRQAQTRTKRANKEQEIEAFERAQILAEGGNPEAVFLERKRNAAAEAKKQVLANKVQQASVDMYVVLRGVYVWPAGPVFGAVHAVRYAWGMAALI